MSPKPYITYKLVMSTHLPRAAGLFEGKDSQHILLHLRAVNRKQC